MITKEENDAILAIGITLKDKLKDYGSPSQRVTIGMLDSLFQEVIDSAMEFNSIQI